MFCVSSFADVLLLIGIICGKIYSVERFSFILSFFIILMLTLFLDLWPRSISWCLSMTEYTCTKLEREDNFFYTLFFYTLRIWLFSTLSGGTGSGDDGKDKYLNIFSLASGHLYERLMRIMILSIIKQTKSPVKFWLLKNYLSPEFKVRYRFRLLLWIWNLKVDENK